MPISAENLKIAGADTEHRVVHGRAQTLDKQLFPRLAGAAVHAVFLLSRDNAGNPLHKAFDQTTEEDLDKVYSVHFKGVFFLTQKLLPLIHDGGRIVNISSGLTRFTIPELSAYASMKGAVEVLSKHMAKELGPRRIAVNVVAPGATETDFSGGIVRDNPAANNRVAEGTALGRAGVPEDVGRMIASLLSEDNRWINAERIEVTGGYV